MIGCCVCRAADERENARTGNIVWKEFQTRSRRCDVYAYMRCTYVCLRACDDRCCVYVDYARCSRRNDRKLIIRNDHEK